MGPVDRTRMKKKSAPHGLLGVWRVGSGRVNRLSNLEGRVGSGRIWGVQNLVGRVGSGPGI